MRSTCPSCDTAYTIPDDRIGPKGRKVRCTRCGEQWHVVAPDDDPGLAAFRAEADDPFDDVAAIEPSAPTAAAAPDAVARDAVATITDDPFEIAADAHAETDAIEVSDHPAPAPAPPVDLEAGDAPSDPPRPETRPKSAPLKRVGRRPPLVRMPRLPAAVTRLAPFAGPAVFLGACLILVGLVVFRVAVVSNVPALAGFYHLVGLEVNLRGLDFGPIETLRETADGQPVLVVEGSLANTSGASRPVPALRFALRDAEGQELYAWSVDPRASVIAAGDRLRFRTRLVAPPERASDLQVRFAERRNRQAGLP